MSDRPQDTKREFYSRLNPVNDSPGSSNACTCFEQGKSAACSGDIEQAIAAFTLVVEMANVPPELLAMALLARAWGYHYSGNKENAHKDIHRALETASSEMSIRVEALLFRASLNREDNYLSAIEDCSEVLAMPTASNENKITALFLRASLYEARGLHELEIADLDHVISSTYATAGQKAHALMMRGSVYAISDHLDRCISDYNRAIDLLDNENPDKTYALFQRGTMRSLAGDFNGARADWGCAKRRAYLLTEGEAFIHEIEMLMEQLPHSCSNTWPGGFMV